MATTPGDSPSQIWPLYLKINHISPDQFKTVSGDAKTKLNAVISGQADLIIGYVMDQNIKMIRCDPQANQPCCASRTRASI